MTGRRLRFTLLVMLTAGLVAACLPDTDDPRFLRVQINGQSMSKLPFVIAWEQGLYEKYGLDVELNITSPEFDGGVVTTATFLTRALRKVRIIPYPETDLRVNGLTPTMVREVRSANVLRQVALATTDCSVRYYLVARPGITAPEELKGQRIGVNLEETTSGYATLRLIERMGWDRNNDVSVLQNGRAVEDILAGQVDAIMGGDEAFEAAAEAGLPILLDTRDWDDSLAGNSLLVIPEWLERPGNRDAAKRFLQALLEALEIFHQNPDLAIDIAHRFYGMPSREFAAGRYQRADYVPDIPYPCYEGIQNTIDLYDSHEMRKYPADYFFDDSLLRELVN